MLSLPISGSSVLSYIPDFMAVMLELRIVIFELIVIYSLLGCSFMFLFYMLGLNEYF